MPVTLQMDRSMQDCSDLGGLAIRIEVVQDPLAPRLTKSGAQSWLVD
jgi:hypothetical protein